ncbi:acyl-coenzyme A thioesterase 11-like [Sycon ciliatum]|uniref:acyl-coenzyme A thioesterase 11-like n=1 Tax=Sycon ciliatum TaxID=27933 RepID=UPI0031F616F6
MASQNEQLAGQHRDRPPPKSSAASKIEMQQLVLPRDANVDGEQLHPGQLLKWIDVAACLSAERHCDKSCVTVSMDGVYFDRIPRVGNIVILKAQVTRAFDSSMEVLVLVTSEDRCNRVSMPVCKAYLTFIARLKEKKKIKLPLAFPETQDRAEYHLASERRATRLKLANTIKSRADRGDVYSIPVTSSVPHMLREPTLDRQYSPPPQSRSIEYSHQTRVSSIELVLPQHGNHHQSVTFGGQIMEWMATAAFIAASRMLPSIPVLQAIDIVRFRAESHVGDRVQIQAQVNRSFADSVEVGCRVEARDVGEACPRHINTSFLSFTCLNLDRPSRRPSAEPRRSSLAPSAEPRRSSVARILPSPDDPEDVRRFEEALVRYHMRLERASFLKSIQNGAQAAPTWSKAIAEELILSNYERVTKWNLVEDWHLLVEDPDITMSKHQSGDELCMQLRIQVNNSAQEVFSRVCNPKLRSQWDVLCKSFDVVEQYTEQDAILHVHYAPRPGQQKNQDFVVLMSARTPHAEGDAFTVCFRSVRHLKYPPTENADRGIMTCSGYVIEPAEQDSDACQLNSNMCQLTYIQEVSSDSLSYFAGDLMGISNLLVHLGRSLLNFLNA